MFVLDNIIDLNVSNGHIVSSKCCLIKKAPYFFPFRSRTPGVLDYVSKMLENTFVFHVWNVFTTEPPSSQNRAESSQFIPNSSKYFTGMPFTIDRRRKGLFDYNDDQIDWHFFNRGNHSNSMKPDVSDLPKLFTF